MALMEHGIHFLKKFSTHVSQFSQVTYPFITGLKKLNGYKLGRFSENDYQLIAVTILNSINC